MRQAARQGSRQGGRQGDTQGIRQGGREAILRLCLVHASKTSRRGVLLIVCRAC